MLIIFILAVLILLALVMVGTGGWIASERLLRVSEHGLANSDRIA